MKDMGKIRLSYPVLWPRSCERSNTLFKKYLLLFLTWREYFYSQPTRFSSQPKCKDLKKVSLLLLDLVFWYSHLKKSLIWKQQFHTISLHKSQSVKLYSASLNFDSPFWNSEYNNNSVFCFYLFGWKLVACMTKIVWNVARCKMRRISFCVEGQWRWTVG